MSKEKCSSCTKQPIKDMMLAHIVNEKLEEKFLAPKISCQVHRLR